MMRLTILAVHAALFFTAWQPIMADYFGNYDPHEYKAVSLIALIANPQKFHNKKVMVEGFFRHEFELQGLFLSKEDAKKLIGMNAAWIETDGKLLPERVLRRLNGKWIGLLGVVYAPSIRGDSTDIFAFEVRDVKGVRLID